MPIIFNGQVIDGAMSRVLSLLLGSPALGTNDSVLADTRPGAAGSTVTAGITDPDLPRNLTVKGNQVGVAGNVTVHGETWGGAVISEVFALSGASAITGNKIFRKVTSVVLPAENQSTDRVRVGTGAKLGIPILLKRNTVLHGYLADVREAVAAVAFHATLPESNSITMTSTLDGTPVRVDLYGTY